jgi:hypothetical protein
MLVVLLDAPNSARGWARQFCPLVSFGAGLFVMSLGCRSLPRAVPIAQGCAEGHSLEPHHFPFGTFATTASRDWALATAA